MADRFLMLPMQGVGSNPKHQARTGAFSAGARKFGDSADRRKEER